MHVTSNRWTLVIALAALVMGAGFVAPLFRIVVQAQTSQQAADGGRLMRGAVELHYHVDPGYGVYEHLAQAKAAGVRALLLKNHYEPTGALVMLLRPQFPGLELYAGFVFNRSNGGINVPGVEYMASISGDPKPGKIVWLPAGDTEKEARGGRNPNPNASFVAVTKNGQLLPEVKQALAVIAKNNFTLASGHVIAAEALLVFREARAAGVQRLIATHAADLTGKMTLDQMKEAAEFGAWSEVDYRNTLEENRTDLIRGVGPDHCFLSEFWTKNQQPKEYAGAAGVGVFAAEMKKRGFTERELEMMFKDNPAKAIGLPVATSSAGR